MNKLAFIFLVTIILTSTGFAQKTSLVKFASDESPDVVKAMTFNIRVDTFLDALGNSWNSRRQIVFDTIAANTVDIFGLQEALGRQVRQIQDALPQYENYMAGRDDGKQKGESCAIFYRKDRFTLDDKGTFWFSNTPSKPGSKTWGNIWPRICTWVHLIDNHTGSGFYVYNVHLDVISQGSREKSVELLAQRIFARKTSDPFIVMGDFNMDLNNRAVTFLLNTSGQTPYPKMIDSWQSLNLDRSKAGTEHGFHGRLSGSHIDHIPTSEDIKAT